MPYRTIPFFRKQRNNYSYYDYSQQIRVPTSPNLTFSTKTSSKSEPYTKNGDRDVFLEKKLLGIHKLALPNLMAGTRNQMPKTQINSS